MEYLTLLRRGGGSEWLMEVVDGGRQTVDGGRQTLYLEDSGWMI